MKIRKSTLEDSAEIARLHRGTIRSVNSKDYPPEDIEVWSGRAKASRVRDSHSIAVRYVAIEKGKIIGFVDISKENPEKLWGLYIHKDFIGKGVGTKLLEKIEQVAKRMGAKTFEATATITAKAFYEAKGFKVIKKEKHPIEHRLLDVFVMQRGL
jgi:putative acetyltransferase